MLRFYALLPALAAAAGAPFCGTCANGGAPPMDNTMLALSCTTPGAQISSILFASYGNPRGSCPAFTTGACNAATSLAVVQALCLGRAACVVWPNTTTFSDPCFGTPKELAIVATCSTGAGSGTCSIAPPPPPPPPPPPLANFTTAISIDFAHILGPLRTEPSLQVVSQHLLFRDSPIAATAWDTLKEVGGRNIRFVPWIPYSQYGVGALMPPSGAALCTAQAWAAGSQTRPVALDCGAGGGTLASIAFASYGRPSGNCGNYSRGACHAPTSQAVVEGLCLGKASCVIPMDGFGADPCAGSGKWLAVQATCSSPSAQHTYWNLTLADQFFSDFWAAVDGNNTQPIPNFSTQPTWLFSPQNYNWHEDPDAPWYGYDRGAAPAANVTALGEYYGRLWSYFINNRFTDEYGVEVVRSSGPAMNVSIIEVFNEVDYEHAHTPQSYTLEYDAYVLGVRRLADPEHRIRFVGLTLPNIDPAATVLEWATYFLNASNHHPDVGLDALNFIGIHAYPTNHPYTPNPDSFAILFDYVDDFFATKVLPTEALIAALSPATEFVLDETGTDMDNVLGAGPPPGNNPRYWVASAAYYAYFLLKAARDARTVRVVGASQLMDAPGQEPSVTMLDWSSGQGTARLWVVAMLVRELAQGAPMAATSAVSTGAGAAQALAVGRKVLVINQRNAWTTATLGCTGGGGCVCASVVVIDEANGLQPAREEACGAGNSVLLAPYATAVVRLQG